MEPNAIIFVVLIIVGLAVIAGMILLQIFLSKRDSKWFGLILPAISFLLSLIYPMSMISTGDLWQDVLLFAVTLLLANIFTIVLVIIYAAIRENRKKKAQLEKMSVQDLG